MNNPTPASALPQFENLRWQALTKKDLPDLTALAQACLRTDGGLHFLFEPEELASLFFPDAPGTACGAWNSERRLVACAAVNLAGEAQARRSVILGHVHPEWRRRGLGTALLDWSKSQAEALLAAEPAGHRLLQVRTEALTEPAAQLYRKSGFQQSFEEWVMRRELARPQAEPVLPEGVTLTNWQPDLAEAFFQAYQEAFRTRPGFPNWTLDEWLDDDIQAGWSLLARREAQPLGFLTAMEAHPGAYIIQLGVIPSERHSGLASALMFASMRCMQADGILSAQLAVNANNPAAQGLFARLGFESIGRRARFVQTL